MKTKTNLKKAKDKSNNLSLEAPSIYICTHDYSEEETKIWHLNNDKLKPIAQRFRYQHNSILFTYKEKLLDFALVGGKGGFIFDTLEDGRMTDPLIRRNSGIQGFVCFDGKLFDVEHDGNAKNGFYYKVHETFKDKDGQNSIAERKWDILSLFNHNGTLYDASLHPDSCVLALFDTLKDLKGENPIIKFRRSLIEVLDDPSFVDEFNLKENISLCYYKGSLYASTPSEIVRIFPEACKIANRKEKGYLFVHDNELFDIVKGKIFKTLEDSFGINPLADIGSSEIQRITSIGRNLYDARKYDEDGKTFIFSTLEGKVLTGFEEEVFAILASPEKNG